MRVGLTVVAVIDWATMAGSDVRTADVFFSQDSQRFVVVGEVDRSLGICFYSEHGV